MSTVVLKFGGASVSEPHRFSHVADIVLSRCAIYDSVVVVVSAMQGATSQLLDLAMLVNPYPPKRELDMMVSVGERVSIALLAMALSRKGCEAISLTGSQSGILTCESHCEARILEVRPHRLLKHLNERKVVIVAGFQGVSQSGEITTLGRGGSDTSAVALGVSLGAEKVEFFKDVNGVYCRDPKKCTDSVKFSFLSYSDALKIVQNGAKVLHYRAVELAAKNSLPLHVLSFRSASEDLHSGTWIGPACKESLPPCNPVYEGCQV